LFARGVEACPDAVRRVLEDLSDELRHEIQAIAERGRFSKGCGAWRLERAWVPDGEPEYLTGEGPAGLSIDVYRRVVLVTCDERFHTLYDDSLGLAIPLRSVLCSFALKLGASPRIAVAAGGFGDTDRANDLAYYKDGSFEEVCACLAEVIGPPAGTWAELAHGVRGWYSGPPHPYA
jgi:hypothetical protein